MKTTDMKNFMIIMAMALTILPLQGQLVQELSIEQCYSFAKKAYPLADNHELISAQGRLNEGIARKNFLPSLYLKAEAKYLSDVFELAVPVPGVTLPSPTNDQYDVSIILNQLFYDGGMTRKSAQMEKQAAIIEESSLEVELYKLRDRVNNIYFSILYLQHNDSLYSLSAGELDERLLVAGSAVRNGSMLQSELDQIKAEKLMLEQLILENGFNISKGVKVLSQLIDSTLTDSVRLLIPDAEPDYMALLTRPELFLFDMQAENSMLGTEMLSSGRKPRLSGFGQFGYGQPGINPINDSFDSYYVLGFRLSWNIYDWKKTRQEKDVLELQRQMILNRKESFKFNTRQELSNEKEEIAKYKALVEKDMELIELRENILEASASRLDNGVIQSADYLTEFNKYLGALVKLNIHELLMVRSKLNYIYKQGAGF